MSNIRRTHDLTLDIARGSVAGSRPFNAYGKLSADGAISNEVIWAGSDWSIPPQTGIQLKLASSSPSDTSNGVGIRSIRLHDLDNNLDEQTEDIALNGAAEVLSLAENVRFVQCGYMLTFGSSRSAVGTITIKGVGEALYNQIEPSDNRCSSSSRMVPRDCRAIVKGVIAGCMSGSASARGTVSLSVSKLDNEPSILFPHSSLGLQDGSISLDLPVPVIAEAGSVVAMVCSVDKSATLTGDWFGWLEPV